jgi:hypothetical protein
MMLKRAKEAVGYMPSAYWYAADHKETKVKAYLSKARLSIRTARHTPDFEKVIVCIIARS